MKNDEITMQGKFDLCPPPVHAHHICPLIRVKHFNLSCLVRTTHKNHWSYYMEPQNILFQLKQPNTPNWSFWDCHRQSKNAKRVVQIIGHLKNEPGTQTEPFKPIWLTLGDHGKRNTRQRLVWSNTGDLFYNNQLLSFFWPNGWSNILNSITQNDLLMNMTLNKWKKLITTII